jgi:GNAT superfamily N-acetyltransferase
MLVPSDMQITLWEKVKGGLLTLIFIYGYSIFSRMISASDHYDNIRNEMMSNRRHFELQRMIVNPNYQGQGLGSLLLQQALDEEDKKDTPVFLTTQAERNVTFYSRL